MTRFYRLTIFIMPFFILSGAMAEPLSGLKEKLITDYKNFYLEGENLLMLGTGIAGSGIMANTSMDREVQRYYQDSLRDETTDHISDIIRPSGTWYITVPILGFVSLLSDNATPSQWSQHSLRAILVGAPAGLFLQRATGAGRPEEGDSRWHPFRDSNGLSGHAFIGSVPFITAAMMTENRGLRFLYYSLSVLPGLSRLNDNKHYLSQVSLGWYLGYLSARAVNKGEDKRTFVIAPYRGGIGALLIYKF